MKHKRQKQNSTSKKISSPDLSVSEASKDVVRQAGKKEEEMCRLHASCWQTTTQSSAHFVLGEKGSWTSSRYTPGGATYIAKNKSDAPFPAPVSFPGWIPSFIVLLHNPMVPEITPLGIQFFTEIFSFLKAASWERPWYIWWYICLLHIVIIGSSFKV